MLCIDSESWEACPVETPAVVMSATSRPSCDLRPGSRLSTSEAISPRYTDYEGSVQAVMATDTLLNALVNAGHVGAGSAASIRGDINRAYRAVRDPNAYRPLDFRAALGRAASAIRALR